MSLSTEQHAWLKELLADCELHESRLSDWEGEFVLSTRDRFLQYGADTRLSPKQMEVLQKIETKIHAT